MNRTVPKTQHDGSAFPKCPRCGKAMTISRIMPAEPGHETRTYHCAGCDEERSETVRLAPKS